MSEFQLGSKPFKKFKGFLSPLILDSLTEIISKSKRRRLEYNFQTLDDIYDIEPPVADATAYTSEKFGLSFNFAILKWYKTTDVYLSEAYSMHVDPPEFRSIPLFLFTLYGDAELFVQTSSDVQERCEVSANDLVVLHPELPHRISEPTNADGIRYYFFLGKKVAPSEFLPSD